MPRCPPVFTNYHNTFETEIGNCFQGFWYHPDNRLNSLSIKLVVPSNVAYDYNRNCVTVNGLPVVPDCNGVFSAIPEFTAFGGTPDALINQGRYWWDVPKSGHPFIDPAACDKVGVRRAYLLSTVPRSLVLTDSRDNALWINAAVYSS